MLTLSAVIRVELFRGTQIGEYPYQDESRKFRKNGNNVFQEDFKTAKLDAVASLGPDIKSDRFRSRGRGRPKIGVWHSQKLPV